MSEPKFQPGDMVQRKQGGPLMRVQDYHPEQPGNVRCCWQLNTRVFDEVHHEDQLRKVEPDAMKVSAL